MVEKFLDRISFPMHIAFAETIDISEGRSCNAILLDIVNPPFASGHLTVALSRAKDEKRIGIFRLDRVNVR